MIKEANIISLKDFRLSTTKYINRVKKGENFTVLRKNEPIFMISKPALYDITVIPETDPTESEKRSLILGKKDFENGNFVSLDQIKKEYAWQ